MTSTQREPGIERLQADEKRFRKIARERFSISLMNNTKWREMVDAVQGLHLGGYRVKFIDDEKVWEVGWIISPAPSYIDGEEFGPVLFVAIEWLEILISKLTMDSSKENQITLNELCHRLQIYQIPFSEDSDALRVVGYLRV